MLAISRSVRLKALWRQLMYCKTRRIVLFWATDDEVQNATESPPTFDSLVMTMPVLVPDLCLARAHCYPSEVWVWGVAVTREAFDYHDYSRRAGSPPPRLLRNKHLLSTPLLSECWAVLSWRAGTRDCNELSWWRRLFWCVQWFGDRCCWSSRLLYLVSTLTCGDWVSSL